MPIGFAHRGASADAPENTLAAFALALELGATGLESDVWLTRDGEPVLHHGGKVPGGAIGGVRAADLPPWLPRLADLFRACGTGFDLSLDLKDARSARAVLAVAGVAGHDRRRLWLCGRGPAPLTWRGLDAEVRLVADTRLVHVRGGVTAYLTGLREGGVDAVNLRQRRWTPGLVRRVHAAGLLAFGWDAQTARRLAELLRLGCDAVYSDHVALMVEALRAGGGSAPAG